MANRTCSKCGLTKPLDEYHRGGRAKDGRVARCKPCVAGHHRAHYLANKEKIIARTSEYQKADPERTRNYSRRYHAANREKRRAYSESYRAADPERNKRQMAEWRAGNPGKYRKDAHRRRAMLAGVAHDPAVTLDSLRARDGDFCCYCARLLDFNPRADRYAPDRATIDHITPISRGGSHTFDNAAASCRSCNLSKNARAFIWEWIGKRNKT